MEMLLLDTSRSLMMRGLRARGLLLGGMGLLLSLIRSFRSGRRQQKVLGFMDALWS